MTITFAQMTQNRQVETVHCLEKYLPYVDKAVIVDGGSIDDSIFYLRNWASQEPKLEFYIYPWTDNFSAQRNNYLQHVPDNTWVLVSDPDEVFETSTLENLRQLVQEAESKGKDMVGFQCRSVSYKGPNRVWENLDNYWKRLLFKKYPSTKYAGNPHEHLVGHRLQIMDTPFLYEHRKQENVIWHRGARNMFTGGGGPNLGSRNQYWVRLREICSAIGVNTWHQFDALLMKGEIPQDLRSWIIAAKDLNGWDGSSEHREVYKLFFRVYHPEQEPAESKGLHIP